MPHRVIAFLNMHRAKFFAALAVVSALFLAAPPTFAQQHNYTPGDIEEGGRLFRLNCVGCHGPDGDLVPGIDLGHNKFRTASTDEDLIHVMQNGVPGTGMPANNLVEARAAAIVAYLRSMASSSGVSSIAGLRGDEQRGKSIFEGTGACTSCAPETMPWSCSMLLTLNAPTP